MSRIIDVVNKITMFHFRNLQLVIYGKAKGRGR